MHNAVTFPYCFSNWYLLQIKTSFRIGKHRCKGKAESWHTVQATSELTPRKKHIITEEVTRHFLSTPTNTMLSSFRITLLKNHHVIVNSRENLSLLKEVM